MNPVGSFIGDSGSGRCNSLNAILGTDVLPVGVTPITAIPTRIVHGEQPVMRVWFPERPEDRFEVSRLGEFVAEQQNPGNTKHVTRIVVEPPAARLRDGITFVDTPGLGSLATKRGHGPEKQAHDAGLAVTINLHLGVAIAPRLPNVVHRGFRRSSIISA